MSNYDESQPRSKSMSATSFDREGDKVLFVDSGDSLYKAAQQVSKIGLDAYLAANPPTPSVTREESLCY